MTGSFLFDINGFEGEMYMNNYYKIRNDIMFKTIFQAEENRPLLKRLIEEVIHEEVEIENVLMSELNNDRISIRRKVLDVIVKANGKKINIEINSNNRRYFRRRNAAYVFKLYSDSIRKGSSYNMMDEIIQINLSVEYEETGHFPLIGEYTIHDTKINRDYIDNFKIYEINITEMAKLCYNGEKEMCLLGMLDMNYDEIVSIEGDEYMDKLKDEAIKLNNDDEMIELMSAEEEEEMTLNTYKAMGIEEGMEKGIEENKLDMVKKMLKENIDTSTISKVSGLSKERIEEIDGQN